ncbi:MAG: Gfo/Idh/MocA family oxidoreductase [Clostridia bacterium]|nr:Gfo/Idh/MocA family oxidoreductase [Clostridia bacterium]
MEHFLIAGHGYIGGVHEFTAPIAAHFLVRHLPKEPGIYYTDFKEAMVDKPLFLDICTPNISHKELFCQAAQYGLPVYCEKPLSISLEDAREMCKTAEQKNIYNGVAFNYRFLPCVHLLKKALTEDMLGKIIYYNASFLHDSYILPRPKAWRTSKEAGGGALADLGIHLFDLCRFVFGEAKLTDCRKHIEFPERTEVDEYARCTLQHQEAVGYLEISRISAGRAEENGIDVFGHGGSIRIRFDKPQEMEFFDIKTKETHIIKADAALLDLLHFPDSKHDMGMFYGSHKAAITTFIKHLKSGTKSDILADFADGVAAQKMLNDALHNNHIEL